MTRDQYESVKRALHIAQAQAKVAGLEEIVSRVNQGLDWLEIQWLKFKPEPMPLHQQDGAES